jgi:hypothetical protein
VVHPTDETGHCERAICLFLSTSYEPALAKNPPLPLRSLRVTQVTTSRTNRATRTGPATPRSSHCRDPALSGTGHEHVRKGTKVFEALAYALGQFANLGAGEWSGRHGDSLAHRPVSRRASSASRAVIPLS